MDTKSLENEKTELTQNYLDMDETGKEKLLEEMEKLFEVHKEEKNGTKILYNKFPYGKTN